MTDHQDVGLTPHRHHSAECYNANGEATHAIELTAEELLAEHTGRIDPELLRKYEESTPIDLIIEENYNASGGGLGSGPAGEATRAARTVQVSRLALAAKLKQGVPMSELTAHFTTLSIAEGVLLSK